MAQHVHYVLKYKATSAARTYVHIGTCDTHLITLKRSLLNGNEILLPNLMLQRQREPTAANLR